MMRCSYIPEGGSLKDVPVYLSCVAAAFVGTLTWMITYPPDVVKSSMQSDQLDRAKRRFTGYVHCVKYLYRREGGIGRFYRGISPCLIRSVPAVVIQFSTMELCRKYLPL